MARYRTASRTVTTTVEVSEAPDYAYPDPHRRPIAVRAVRLVYHTDDEDSYTDAYVVGVYVRKGGTPGKVNADEYTGRADRWPAWLTEIANEHRPAGYVTLIGQTRPGADRKVRNGE